MTRTGSSPGSVRERKDADNPIGIAFMDEQSVDIRQDHLVYSLFQ